MTVPASQRPGFVYVLSNPSMKGLFKIGSTDRHPSIRAAELSQMTGVPTPFVVQTFYEVTDRTKAERAVHAHLSRWRVDGGREFFEIGRDDALVGVTRACRVFRPAPPPWVAAGECPNCWSLLSSTDVQQVGRWDGFPGSDRPGGSLVRLGCGDCGSVCLAAVCGDFSVESEFWDISRDVEKLMSIQNRLLDELEALRCKASEGRCPLCDRPVISFDRSVVTGAAGQRTYWTVCEGCGKSLRARSDQERDPWLLRWEE